MPSSSHTPFLTIRAEGALLPVDLLQRVVENDRDLGGLPPDVLGIYVYLPKVINS